MFTINIYLKLAIIFACFIGGIIMIPTLGFWYAFPFLLIGLIFLVSYFLLGTVQSAAQLVEQQQFAAAEKRLNFVIAPKLLYVTNRAYYYIMRGNIEMQKNNNQEGEAYFKKASSLNLPSDTERAMVYLQLGGLAMQRNNWAQVQRYAKQLKELDPSEEQVKEAIKQFLKAYKNRGSIKTAQQQQRRGFRNLGGGKRRRPRMR